MKTNHRYSAAVDGLRLVAFAVVFVHHMPAPPDLPIWSAIAPKGWFGVDLFFAISSYLLFKSLHSEHRRNGKISVGRFFLRRAARIVPLMFIFALSVTLLMGTGDPKQWGLFASYVLFIVNFVWVANLAAGEVPWLSHLWSLSFEFQLYLCVPVLFWSSKRLSKRAMLSLIAAICLYATLGRQVVQFLGAPHPVVYMTPLLRPESFLFGIALAVADPKWDVRVSALFACLGFGVASLIAQPWDSLWSAFVTYPLLGVGSASAIDWAVRGRLLTQVLAWRPVSYLGERSYGLYIFHLVFIHTAYYFSGLLSVPANEFVPWLTPLSFALVPTCVCAALSYALIERPIYTAASRL